MSVDPNTCEHVELYPPRNPAALRVCVECGTAVLDFDAVYITLPNGHQTIGGELGDDGEIWLTEAGEAAYAEWHGPADDGTQCEKDCRATWLGVE